MGTHHTNTPKGEWEREMPTPEEERAAAEAAAAAAEKTGDSEVTTLKAQLAEATARIADVNKVLMSPEYAEFMAGKVRQAVKSTEKKEFTATERAEFEERLNSMTRAQLAAFIRDAVKGEILQEVRDNLWTPLQQELIQDRTQRDIAAAQTKYPDFWDFQAEMTAIAKSTPGLTVDQVYLLAKAAKGGKTEEKATPARRAAPEVPGTRVSTSKPQKPLSFQEAFDQAAAKAGIT